MAELVEGAIEAIRARRALYASKMEQSDPLAADSYSRWDAMKLVVEALDLTLNEAEASAGLPMSEPIAYGVD